MRHQSYLIIIFLILVCLIILITPAYASEELNNPIRNKCAFSYWCDGKSERMYNHQAKETAIKVAAMAMNGILVEITLEATHYHTRAVNPYWARHDKLMYLGSLGSHLFYIEN